MNPKKVDAAAPCFPLTCACNGQKLCLKEIRAGGKLRQRLADLGLNTGMSLRVVNCETCGPIILAVTNDSRLAIGRGMAQKIMVAYQQEDE
jgi:Fe2+ transport system protein FeoA